MNNRLEDFVRDHREEFDSEEPDNKIWEKISREMDPDKKKQTPVVQIPIRWIKWSAAVAAILLLIVGADWYVMRAKSTSEYGVADQPKPADQAKPNNATNTNPSDTSAKNSTNLAQTPSPAVANPTSDSPALAGIRPRRQQGSKGQPGPTVFRQRRNVPLCKTRGDQTQGAKSHRKGRTLIIQAICLWTSTSWIASIATSRNNCQPTPIANNYLKRCYRTSNCRWNY